MMKRAVYAFTTTVVLACGLWASTVIQVSIQEMVATSEFVFEGTVVGQEAVRPDGSSNIFTRVTFAVSDVLKGDYDTSTVSLYFMGGTIGSLTLSISDMQIPKNGERGIYFVESFANRQVGVRVAMERKPGVFASFRRAIRVPALHFAGL